MFHIKYITPYTSLLTSSFAHRSLHEISPPLVPYLLPSNVSSFIKTILFLTAAGRNPFNDDFVYDGFHVIMILTSQSFLTGLSHLKSNAVVVDNSYIRLSLYTVRSYRLYSYRKNELNER